ncbi:hypothetical protein EIP91_004883 [Steccherinum ochraceum]|uniref:Uncharacterized protein n=1 Tax=Steccherinum ochraceum TaxID=92696 RepID=A0A4R0R812_9APHY|nr:hypothetical protein EIP91_004883 [Steccherinum ochraceum]
MPAPQSSTSNIRPQEGRPVLGHVNLMVDTLIVNANIDDLRAIVRATLASSPPSMAGTFSAAARNRLQQTNANVIRHTGNLFGTRPDGLAEPTPELRSVLVRVRALYGAGLGLASLKVLVSVVEATGGRRWHEKGEMENTFSDIDADISQALQSTREEIDGGRVPDLSKAREMLRELRIAIQESQREVESWGGVFPFERAAATLEFWKL